MKKINKISNIALISMLIGVVLCTERVYALRPPLRCNRMQYSFQPEQPLASMETAGREIKPWLQEEIPTHFKVRSTGERLIVVKMDGRIFKMHRKAIVDIAKTLYDKAPLDALESASPERVNGHACYVAMLDGEVTGYVFAYDDEYRVTIETLGVSSDKREKGIANTLVWITTREAQNRNIPTIAIKGVDPANKSMLEFLAHHGFEIPKGLNQKRRFDSEAPVSSVFEKTSKKLAEEMLTGTRLGLLLGKVTRFLKYVKTAL